MNYSNTQTETLALGGTRSRARWGVVAALVALLAIFFSGFTGIAPASAAPQFSVTKTFDGRDQLGPDGCPIQDAGGDLTSTDGVVCTNDYVGYKWEVNVPPGETPVVSFVAQAPEGVTWSAVNLATCKDTPAAGYTAVATLSSDGREFTCTLTFGLDPDHDPANPKSRLVGFLAEARVGATVPNGTSFQPIFTVSLDGSVQQFTPAPVTVRSRAQVDLYKDMHQFRYPDTFNGQAGVSVLVNVAGVQQGSAGLKGIAALESPFSFTDDLSQMPAGTVLKVVGDCRLNPPTGDWTTSSNPGVWNCQQTGDQVSITVTGADTSGSPGHTSPVGAHTVFSGAFELFIPSTSIPEGGITAIDQLRAFDPVTLGGGSSNYGSASDRSGWEPGGHPNDTCEDPANNNNCAQLTLTDESSSEITAYKDIFAANKTLLPVHGAEWIVVPGQDIVAKLVTIVPEGAGNSGLIVCDVFDPAIQQFDPNGVMEVVRTAGAPLPAWRVQYSAQAIPDIDSVSCGSASEGPESGWFDTVAEAGGVSAITSLRLVFDGEVAPGFIDWWVPMTNVATQPGTLGVDSMWMSVDGSPYTMRSRETYIVSANILSVVKSSPKNTAVSGDTLEFTIQPNISFPADGGEPAVITVTDTLPPCYSDPLLLGQTPDNWTMEVTLGNSGPDGLPCTQDAGETGTVLTFVSTSALQPNQPVPPINYSVKSSVRTPTGPTKTQHNFATVSADGNIQDASTRTDFEVYQFAAAYAISIFKSVDAPLVEVAPDQIGFALEWANNLGEPVGETTWIDILPYNGDGRGTNAHGTVVLSDLQATSTNPSDVVISITSTPRDQLNADPAHASNQPGGSTVWCVFPDELSAPGCPALDEVTAIMVTHQSLDPGEFGYLHFTMQPSGNAEGDVYRNGTGPGLSEGFELPVPPSNIVEVEVVASEIGDTVWWDYNEDGVLDPGEPGIPGITVRLYDGSGTEIGQLVTDSNGKYLFTGLHSGAYSVRVDTSTLPPDARHTYDYNDGTTNPNHDSGRIELGIDESFLDADFGYVLDPTTPTQYFSTVASPQSLAPGQSVTDSVSFTGATLAGDYTWRLLGPVAPINDSCLALDWSGAQQVDSGTFEVEAREYEVTTPPVQLNQPGCYTYEGSYQIDGAVSPLVDAAGNPTETVLVSLGTPTLSTVVRTSSNAPGATVYDEVTIGNLSEASTYHWYLYGPVAPVGDSCAAVDWTGVQPSEEGQFAVTPGTTLYQTPEVTASAVGCYTYGGLLDATNSSVALTQAPGDPLESFEINSNLPEVSTEASDNVAAPGQTVSDFVTISGLGATTETPRYTWTLLGPVPAVNGSCAAIDWSSASVFDTDFIDIDEGDGIYETQESILAGAGCYTYEGTLAATSTTLSATSPAGLPEETILVEANTPEVTTQASTNEATAPVSVTDAVFVDGLGEDNPTTYTWGLLGPLPAVNGTCEAVDWTGAGAPTWTGTLDIDGDGEYETSPATTLTVPGCYTYIGSLASTATTSAVSLAAGDPAETVLVLAGDPGVSTQASTNQAVPGTSVYDRVFVAGFDGLTATYSWRLYGPAAPMGDSCVGIDWTAATIAAQGSFTVTGSGEYQTSPSTVIDVAGCYSYDGVLGATDSTPEISLAAGVPEETFLIALNDPGVSTVASTTTATAPATVFDNIFVTGLDGEAVSYTWTLYGPMAPINGVCDGIDWSLAQQVGQGSFTVTGNGTYQSGSSVLSVAGCYSYGGSLAASSTSEGENLPAGHPDETFIVTAATPGISTQVNPQTGAPGQVVRDTITLTGPIPAGTVYTWSLYGPLAPVGDSCAALDWSAAGAPLEGTIVLDGPGVYQSPEATLTEVGCYTYGGSLPATASTAGAVHEPGVPSQTVRIDTSLPSVVTTASDDSGLPGDSFTDSIVITGLSGAETSYDWTLVGPVPAIDGSCVAVDWDGAETLSSGTLEIEGDDTYTTPATIVDEVGCYSYTGVLASSLTTDEVVLAAGDPLETFLIEPFSPSVETRASAATGDPGDSFTDSVIVSGTGGVQAQYTWTLVKSAPDGAGTCAAVDWSTGSVVDSGSFQINGDGTYTTAATTVNEAGCYSYTGSLAATDTSLGVDLAAGDPLETFQVELLLPGIETVASVTAAEPGDVVHDVVRVSDFGLHEALYEWVLLGPIDPIDETCEAVDWSDAPVADTGEFTVLPGTAEYRSTETEIGLPGCYTYAGELAATASSDAAVHDAGDPDETFIVTALVPHVSTQVSSPRVTIGSTVHDSITIEGTRGAEVEVEWVLYGPVAPRGEQCADLGWSDAKVAFEGVLIAQGDGTIQSPEVTLNSLGCYSYEVTLRATDTTAEIVHEVGQPAETTHVVPPVPGLALTGSTVGNFVGGAVALFGLGLAALLIARSRRTGRKSTEA